MYDILSKMNVQVNNHIYLKDPESSELGRKILETSISLIDELGFEEFTFRKLAKEINSTEASIYRYFENKHKLLLYLSSWYWGWMEYRLAFCTANIQSAEQRLEKAIQLITENFQEAENSTPIDKTKLNRIVISESSKSYLTKVVDQENKIGAFAGYKKLVAKIADIVLEINPTYKYPHMLISTIIEGAHLQRYFSEHLPRLTDSHKGEDSIKKFYSSLVFSSIKY
ncbi:TetR/AcrR family transcriptional regulator [Fulvivirgaceae bacterium LMO-SS25]